MLEAWLNLKRLLGCRHRMTSKSHPPAILLNMFHPITQYCVDYQTIVEVLNAVIIDGHSVSEQAANNNNTNL